MSRFAASDDGVVVRLSAPEVAILSRLPALLGSVGADVDDPAPNRLHPHAYREDESDSLELIRLTKDDLAAGRNADVEVFAAQLAESVRAVTLSFDDAEAWLRVLGSARIVLAARRNLFEVDDLSEVSAENPDVALVNLLGAYQQDLSEALLVHMRPA